MTEQEAWNQALEAALATAPWQDSDSAAEYDDIIYDLRSKWIDTDNPLAVWSVISSAYIGHDDRGLPRHPFGIGPRPHPEAQPLHFPLPHWVMRYLNEVAWRLSCLRSGRDWRTYPAFGGNEQADWAAFVQWRDNPTLTPIEAKELVPAALGLAGC